MLTSHHVVRGFCAALALAVVSPAPAQFQQTQQQQPLYDVQQQRPEGQRQRQRPARTAQRQARPQKQQRQQNRQQNQQQAAAATKETTGPKAMREFRAVWVATVANIDWPSKRDLTTEEQKAELIAIFDKCVELNMNAVVLQVRPATDAMYESELEPWSDYLTGQQGKAPEPFYDPLQLAVDEAHARGLELHCWFNPYRSRHPSSKGEMAENHLSKTRPDLVKEYGKHLWLDPGEKEVQEHSLKVMMDVVKRYDIDGVHMDDYFYPYKEKGPDGKTLDFPDEPSWKKYQEGGGKLTRDDWRRNNVDTFVEALYKAIKKEKPYVKLGISPFGIWQPGYPPEVKAGFNQHTELYANAKKWLNEGWVDYYTPQLYWAIASPQSFPYLLRWWLEENTKERHVWPGLYTSKIGQGTFDVEEIINQIMLTRFMGSNGTVHFSMKPFLENKLNINDKLTTKGGVYEKPALVPSYPWLDSTPPAQPKLAVAMPGASADTETTSSATSAAATLKWSATGDEKVWQWALYLKQGAEWNLHVLPSQTTSLDLNGVKGGSVSEAELSAVDRNGNESTHAKVSLGGQAAAGPKTETFGQVQ